METYQRDFIELALEQNALGFGAFTLKSGRVSPYFFNGGQFHTGASLARLGRCYAAALKASGLQVDLLFGPAYKGIMLAASTAIALADQWGLNLPYSFNRKEAKDHGEGGALVGAPLSGRVVIVDDVITAGTAVRESVELICAAGAEPVGVLIGLNRQERGRGQLSAIQEVERDYGIPVVSIIGVDQLVDYLDNNDRDPQMAQAIRAYRHTYGV